jgi:transcriptional regulator with XRE-family HTH domain
MLRKIGTRIYQEMVDNKLNRKKLSKISGVPERTIYLIKNFKGNPTLKTLDKLATAFGLTLEDLCDSTGKK